MTASTVMQALAGKRLPLQNEKLLQAELANLLPKFFREYHLADGLGIIDFYYFNSKIGIEVKIKGNRKDIYRQVTRYCQSSEINVLILLTNRAMGLPEFINGKPCYVVNLGTAWL
jgi:hypothetical protein